VQVELYLTCTGNHPNIVDTMSRVKFLRIAAHFWTLLASLPAFWGISLIKCLTVLQSVLSYIYLCYSVVAETLIIIINQRLKPPLWDKLFKPGACRPKAGAQLISWNCFCPWCLYACVCVSAPYLGFYMQFSWHALFTKATPTNYTIHHDFNCHINERDTSKACLTDHKGFISHHITLLVINSLGS